MSCEQPCVTLLTLASILELRLAIFPHSSNTLLRTLLWNHGDSNVGQRLRARKSGCSGVRNGWGRGGSAAWPVPPLQAFVNKVLEGKFSIHESRRPVLKKHVAAMVCNVQRGLRLEPVALFGAWSDAAEQQVLRSLQRPKLVRSKQAALLALASPPPATWLHASRLSLIITVPRLVHAVCVIPCHGYLRSWLWRMHHWQHLYLSRRGTWLCGNNTLTCLGPKHGAVKHTCTASLTLCMSSCLALLPCTFSLIFTIVCAFAQPMTENNARLKYSYHGGLAYIYVWVWINTYRYHF